MTAFLRHRLARLLIVLTLAVTPAVAVAGCGAAGHYVENVVAHHVANHLLGKKKANRIFCIYSVYRTVHDFSHHSYLFGALNAHQAFKDCEAGYSKDAR